MEVCELQKTFSIMHDTIWHTYIALLRVLFDWFLLSGHEVMPNTAIPSPIVGSDEKEQVLNIGKHPSLVKASTITKYHGKYGNLCCWTNCKILVQGSQKKMQAAFKRKQQEQGETSENLLKAILFLGLFYAIIFPVSKGFSSETDFMLSCFIIALCNAMQFFA